MATDRRQFIQRSAQLGVLLGAGVPLLQACGSSDGGGGARAVTDPIADGLEPEAAPLRIFNYAGYLNPDTVALSGDVLDVPVKGSWVIASLLPVTDPVAGGTSCMVAQLRRWTL